MWVYVSHNFLTCLTMHMNNNTHTYIRNNIIHFVMNYHMHYKFFQDHVNYHIVQWGY